jgi:hypothetical protein
MHVVTPIRLLGFCVVLFGLSNSQTKAFGSPGSGGDSSSNRYDAIDRHALSAPASVEHSVKRLADYLVRPARNDEEKARAIFRWIAENITYDTRAYFTGGIRVSSPDQTLRTRTAVCEGFSGLFKNLGVAAGLEIETIQGFAKGYDSSVGERIGDSQNHVWNAVKIGGEWRLMDATWGGGYVDERGAYVRSFNGYFFFTPPGKFIFTHFPEDPEWQLLDRPVSKKEFERMAFVRPGFFLYGLELDSHQKSDIEATDTLTVTLRAPEETVLLAHLVQNDKTLDPGLAFAQKDGGLAFVRAAFPSNGIYVLRLFAKRKSDPGPAEWVLDYRIRARKTRMEMRMFPEMYQDFMDRDGYLESPMQGRLKSGNLYRFRLSIPGAESAVVLIGKRRIELKKYGRWFEGDTRVIRGEIHVFAKFPWEKQYRGLLKYIGS